MLTHLFFDFFGTLVTYSPSRTRQGYPATHRLLRDAGSDLGYADFLRGWDRVAGRFERAAERSLREYSMHDVCGQFLAETLGHPAPAPLLERFIVTYLAEWNRGVVYLPELPALLERLARRFTLGVITNTHDAALVPDHLAEMGVAHHFCDVITSVEHGARKPAPQIFEHALGALSASADTSLYVGDSRAPDYDGARGAGLAACLIDPDRSAGVPEAHRLSHILELERHLEGSFTARPEDP